jgi:hypothetical protein
MKRYFKNFKMKRGVLYRKIAWWRYRKRTACYTRKVQKRNTKRLHTDVGHPGAEIELLDYFEKDNFGQASSQIEKNISANVRDA